MESVWHQMGSRGNDQFISIVLLLVLGFAILPHVSTSLLNPSSPFCFPFQFLPLFCFLLLSLMQIFAQLRQTPTPPSCEALELTSAMRSEKCGAVGLPVGGRETPRPTWHRGPGGDALPGSS